MNSINIVWEPYFSTEIIIVLAIAAVVVAAVGIIQKLNGAWIRAIALICLIASILSPAVILEERKQLKTIVTVVVDESDSQKLNNRNVQTQQILDEVQQKLKKFDVEVRTTKTANSVTDEETSTALFSALRDITADIPNEQIGGAIFITDGQVHDIPKNANSTGFNAPIHALITGSEDENDKRVIINKAPRFGIVGKEQTIIYTVEDTNKKNTSANVNVLINGELIQTLTVPVGTQNAVTFKIPSGGKSVVEIHTDVGDGEITDVNNRTYATIDGIRENLRVLLISGEPHAGERTWRNLLNSDASVDLIHFTILRPPEKQDNTPVNELSLIAFPTRELFVEKINEFDLIIFDRYRRYRVLPLLYFDNIARYLNQGGAILIAAGPEHAGPDSIETSPLADVMPAAPTGKTIEQPFVPTISKIGNRHPVTRNLPGNRDDKPEWSRWFRQIENVKEQGHILMNGTGTNPLLILNRQEEGRIAMLMSDQFWLWERGFEGGGPHIPLLRRLVHWLMKEQGLEEEALNTKVEGEDVTITRQTMGDNVEEVEVTDPTGNTVSYELKKQQEGLWETKIKATTAGLYRIANQDLTALTHVGPANPREFEEIVSDTNKIATIAGQTNGGVWRVGQEQIRLPSITLSGSGSVAPQISEALTQRALTKKRMNLRTSQASQLVGLKRVELFAGLLGLGLMLLILAGTWVREGR